MEDYIIQIVLIITILLILISGGLLFKKKDMAPSTRILVKQALVASLYVVITWIFRAISFGPIQFRISEALLVLVLFNPRYLSGLTIGTFIANFLLSDLGWIDWTLGVLASIISMILMMKFKKNIWLSLSMPAMINGLIIGAELTYLFKTPFLYNSSSVFLGEFVVLIILGYGLYKTIESNKKFRQLIVQ